jgi:hypothetical protein
MVLKFRRCDLLTNMRNLSIVYVEVEGNEIIAKESGVSFDFEIDVWSRHPSAPCFGDRPSTISSPSNVQGLHRATTV